MTVDATDPALQMLVERVREAGACGTPLRVQGGGSKAFYGEPPSRGALLDTRGLAGVSSYEPTELVVTARCGTPLAELEALLATRSQCLPFEPPHFSWPGREAAPREPPLQVAGDGVTDRTTDGATDGAGEGPADRAIAGTTVGGMVAAGLAGPARAAAGSVRDYLLGATLLNGRAEVLTFGGQVMKNVAGYDVTRLLAGSLGILGVILEVSLKVLPIAPATATLRLEMPEADALMRLARWSGQPLPLNASAWRDGQLLVRLSGADAAVRAARLGLGGEPVDARSAAMSWEAIRHQDDEFFVDARRAVAAGATLWRLSVPQTTPPLGLAGEQMIEWAGGQRWLCTTLPAAAVRQATAAVGGHATAFLRRPRGGGGNGGGVDSPGSDHTDGVFAPLAPPLDRIHRELKRAFDPNGIFNPGRLYPGL